VKGCRFHFDGEAWRTTAIILLLQTGNSLLHSTDLRAEVLGHFAGLEPDRGETGWFGRADAERTHFRRTGRKGTGFFGRPPEEERLREGGPAGQEVGRCGGREKSGVSRSRRWSIMRLA